MKRYDIGIGLLAFCLILFGIVLLNHHSKLDAFLTARAETAKVDTVRVIEWANFDFLDLAKDSVHMYFGENGYLDSLFLNGEILYTRKEKPVWVDTVDYPGYIVLTETVYVEPKKPERIKDWSKFTEWWGYINPYSLHALWHPSWERNPTGEGGLWRIPQVLLYEFPDTTYGFEDSILVKITIERQ